MVSGIKKTKTKARKSAKRSKAPAKSRRVAQQPTVVQDELACQLALGARLKIIGLGGIGCIVLEFLGRYLKSQRHIEGMRLVLIDGDNFEPANDQRMCFQTLGNKAEVKTAETLKSLNPFHGSIVAVNQYVGEENISDLIKSGDHVFLCVDNHPTRRLVAEHCQTLTEVALFSGGNEGVDPPRERGVYGNVQIHIRKDNRDVTAPLTRFHPEIAQAEGDLPGGPNCGELALSTPQILFANLAVASAMCSSFFAYATGNLHYQEVKLDILENRLLPQLSLPRDLTVPQMSARK
jgi:hypothetical protein